MTNDTPKAGDIIEFDHHDGRLTAEVMLVTDDGLALLDLLDGDRPVHTRLESLEGVAVFRPAPGELVAA